MLITRYCNLIGTANIPAVYTKTCPNTPDVFFPLPSFRRAQYTCARKIRLTRETNFELVQGLGINCYKKQKHCVLYITAAKKNRYKCSNNIYYVYEPQDSHVRGTE